MERKHSPLLMDADEYDYWLDQSGLAPPALPPHSLRPPLIRLLPPEEREAKQRERDERERNVPPADRKARTKSIYLIGSVSGVKIGVTQNVDQRFATLQSMNPLDLRIIYSRQVPQYLRLEREIHAIFHHDCIRGEWFQLNDNQIASAISMIDAWEGG